jgi:hypothetical protein
LQIDRINNNGNYEPGNCRFVNKQTQMRNTRQARLWYIGGLKFETCLEAAVFFSVNPETIRHLCFGQKNGKYVYPPNQYCWSNLRYGA